MSLILTGAEFFGKGGYRRKPVLSNAIWDQSEGILKLTEEVTEAKRMALQVEVDKFWESTRNEAWQSDAPPTVVNHWPGSEDAETTISMLATSLFGPARASRKRPAEEPVSARTTAYKAKKARGFPVDLSDPDNKPVSALGSSWVATGKVASAAEPAQDSDDARPVTDRPMRYTPAIEIARPVCAYGSSWTSTGAGPSKAPAAALQLLGEYCVESDSD
ncbi:hypothetical protein HKX48_005307 [Thoreauomyces humboldtii]|nr:hypothetical protein HKX48_005307 [Thoreauomyces humboldtii]